MALKIYSVEVVYSNFLQEEEKAELLIAAASRFDAIEAASRKFEDIISIIVFEQIGEV